MDPAQAERILALLAYLAPILAARARRILALLLLNTFLLLFLAAFGLVPAPLAVAPLLPLAAAAAGPGPLLWAAVAVAAVLAALALVSLVIFLKMTRPPRKTTYDWTPGELGLPYEEFTVKTPDGITLRGWLIRGGDKGPVVAAHGYTSNMGSHYMRVAVEGLARRGYTVAAFDFRGHGSSEGSYTTVGPKEATDLETVVNWVLEKTGREKAALIGYSMGAMTSIIVASRSPRVAVAVADSPPPGLPQAIERGLTYFAHLPPALAAILKPFLEAWARILYGVKPSDYVMWRLAEHSNAHLLVVVGSEDPLVTVEEAERIAAAARKAGRDGEAHVVEGVGHVETVKDPGYIDLVEGFIARHLE